MGEHFISARCGKKEFNLCRQYRYDREFEAGERSALRKIFEGDESPSKGIALVVANIWKLPPEKRSTSRFVVELTDGWYSVGWKVGQLDDPFRFQILSRRLVKGCSQSNDDGYFGVQAPFETICSGCARCRAEMKKKWIFSDALLTPRDELVKQDPTLGLRSFAADGNSRWEAPKVWWKILPINFAATIISHASRGHLLPW